MYIGVIYKQGLFLKTLLMGIYFKLLFIPVI